MIGDLMKSKTAMILIFGALLGVFLLLFSSKQPQRISDTTERAQRQRELTSFLEQTSGVGEVHLQFCVNEEQQIMSAAVICDGGNDPYVSSKVVRLLSAALGLPTNKIEVCGREK